MKKAISKSIIFVGMALIFALSLFVGLCQTTTSTANAALQIESFDMSAIIVEAYDHNGTLLSSDESSLHVTLNNGTSEINDWTSETFKWRDVHHFKISLNLDSLIEADKYNYKYTVTWTPELINSGVAQFDTDHSVSAEIYSETDVEKNKIVKDIYFTVDNNILNEANAFVGENLLGNSYKSHGGYGLYIFTFQEPVTGAKQSQIFELKQDSVSGLSKPIISVKAENSNNRATSAFTFSVDADYKYVNREQIYWSITGTGKDGRAYVLSPGDITNPNTTSSIFPDESVERRGLTFFFDPRIEGTWKAECKIFTDAGEQAQQYEIAYSEKVSTVQGLSTQSLIWIVVGAAAAAGIAVAIIIIVSIKREKVY